MKSIKKLLSTMMICSAFMSLLAIPSASAAGEVTITPVVDVKIGSNAYATYDNQTLSAGDKVRIKYEYTGPETNEIWSEAYYDEDNDINYEAELKGGTSIVMSNFFVDLLDKDYMTAGTPTFYASATANDWLTISSTYATAEKTDAGISFGTMSAYVKGGMYKNSGRIAQVVYTLTKDLDKDIVIGPCSGYNYWFKYATAGVDGVETGAVDYNTTNGGVVFNSVTLKGTTPTPSTPTATAGNAYKERSTFYGDTVEIPTGATQIDATIEKTNATAKTDKIDCPSGVIGGKAKILPIVSYKVGENGVTAGDIFTLILKNGTTELGKWTYTVPAE